MEGSAITGPAPRELVPYGCVPPALAPGFNHDVHLRERGEVTNMLSVTCSFIFSPEEWGVPVQVLSLVGRVVYFQFSC